MYTSNKGKVGINENKETKTNDTSRTDGKNRQEENRAQPSEQQWALWSPTNFMACLGGRQGEKEETYVGHITREEVNMLFTYRM